MAYLNHNKNTLDSKQQTQLLPVENETTDHDLCTEDLEQASNDYDEQIYRRDPSRFTKQTESRSRFEPSSQYPSYPPSQSENYTSNSNFHCDQSTPLEYGRSTPNVTESIADSTLDPDLFTQPTRKLSSKEKYAKLKARAKQLLFEKKQEFQRAEKFFQFNSDLINENESLRTHLQQANFDFEGLLAEKQRISGFQQYDSFKSAIEKIVAIRRFNHRFVRATCLKSRFTQWRIVTRSLKVAAIQRRKTLAFQKKAIYKTVFANWRLCVVEQKQSRILRFTQTKVLQQLISRQFFRNLQKAFRIWSGPSLNSKSVSHMQKEFCQILGNLNQFRSLLSCTKLTQVFQRHRERTKQFTFFTLQSHATYLNQLESMREQQNLSKRIPSSDLLPNCDARLPRSRQSSSHGMQHESHHSHWLPQREEDYFTGRPPKHRPNISEGNTVKIFCENNFRKFPNRPPIRSQTPTQNSHRNSIGSNASTGRKLVHRLETKVLQPKIKRQYIDTYDDDDVVLNSGYNDASLDKDPYFETEDYVDQENKNYSNQVHPKPVLQPVVQKTFSSYEDRARFLRNQGRFVEGFASLHKTIVLLQKKRVTQNKSYAFKKCAKFARLRLNQEIEENQRIEAFAARNDRNNQLQGIPPYRPSSMQSKQSTLLPSGLKSARDSVKQPSESETPQMIDTQSLSYRIQPIRLSKDHPWSTVSSQRGTRSLTPGPQSSTQSQAVMMEFTTESKLPKGGQPSKRTQSTSRAKVQMTPSHSFQHLSHVPKHSVQNKKQIQVQTINRDRDRSSNSAQLSVSPSMNNISAPQTTSENY